MKALKHQGRGKEANSDSVARPRNYWQAFVRQGGGGKGWQSEMSCIALQIIIAAWEHLLWAGFVYCQPAPSQKENFGGKSPKSG